MRKFGLMIVVAAALATSVSACNTVRGVGKDVESGGEAIQRGASEVQKKF